MPGTETPLSRDPLLDPEPGTSPPLSLWHLAEVRFGLAQAALLTSILLCRTTGAPAPVVLVIVAAVSIRSAARLPPLGAVALGPTAWAWFTGFVVNDYGQLSFSNRDLATLALLVGCVAAAHWRR